VSFLAHEIVHALIGWLLWLTVRPLLGFVERPVPLDKLLSGLALTLLLLQVDGEPKAKAEDQAGGRLTVVHPLNVGFFVVCFALFVR